MAQQAPPNPMVEDEEPVGGFRRRAEEEETGEELTGWRARWEWFKAWRVAHKKIFYSIIGAIAGIFLIVLAMMIWHWIHLATRPTLEEAESALNSGAYRLARNFTDRILGYVEEDDRRLKSAAYYIKGAAFCHDAELSWEEDKTPFYRQAIVSLKESKKLGFPEQHRASGWFLLGKSLFICGQIQEALPCLLEAHHLESEHKKQVCWYLAKSYMLQESANYNEAMQYCSEYLKIPGLSKHELEEGLLLEATILVRMGRREEARELFQKVSPDSPFDNTRKLVEAEILMHQAQELKDKARQLERSTGNPQKLIRKSQAESSDVQTEAFDEKKNTLHEDASPEEETEAEKPDGAKTSPQPPTALETHPFVEHPAMETVVMGRPRKFEGVVAARAEVSEKGAIRPVVWLQEEADASVPAEAVESLADDREIVEKELGEIEAEQLDSPAEKKKNPRTPPNAAPPVELPQRVGSDGTKPESNLVNENLAQAREYRRQALEKYREAIDLLQEILEKDVGKLEPVRKAAFLKAICFREIGDFEAAKEVLQFIAVTFPNSPEAVASEFLWAEMERQLGGPTREVLTAYQRALESFGNVEHYVNPWFTRREIENRVVEAFEDYVEIGEYIAALSLWKYFDKLIDPARRSRLKAELFYRWAKELAQSAEVAPADERKRLLEKVRKKYREAGQAFEELAKKEFTREEYYMDLWQSAECYRLGRDYIESVRMYRKYLDNEVLHRQSRALYYIGEMLYDMDQLDRAIETLRECILLYPNDPMAYRSRLIAGYALLEKGETAKAEQMFQQNLNGRLAPTASEFRDTLFALGKLYWKQEDYPQTIIALEDAVTLYPRAPQSAWANYLIAMSYLSQVREKMEEVKGMELPTTQKKGALEVNRGLQKALNHLRAAQDLLNERKETEQLTEPEQMMLRNCYFGIGSILVDLGQDRFDEAISAYSAAATRFQDSPDALQAYRQIARIYWMMDQDEEAEAAVNRGKLLLERLKAAENFKEDNPFSPRQWQELLEEQKEIL